MVTALCATGAGDLFAATGDGDLALISVAADSDETRAADGRSAQELVTAFFDASSEVPDDVALNKYLIVTNGERTWKPEDLETVTTATETDPAWLRIRAAVNRVRAHEE